MFWCSQSFCQEFSLSLSYQIVVERRGSRLTCQSIPGQGIKFVSNIPILKLSSHIPHLKLNHKRLYKVSRFFKYNYSLN